MGRQLITVQLNADYSGSIIFYNVEDVSKYRNSTIPKKLPWVMLYECIRTSCKVFHLSSHIVHIVLPILYYFFYSFHAHTLTLYAALCYQSNYRAAHALCLHVDQKQLLYAICSEYMSGPLRQGFYDLLIALHLESHATTM